MTDYSELKKAAESATAGVWRYGPGDGEESPIVFIDLPQASSTAISVLFEADWATDHDAKFVSLANPAAVIALVAENEQLKAELGKVKESFYGLAKCFKQANETISTFYLSIKKLKEQNSALKAKAK